MKVSHSFFASDGSSVEAVTIGEAMDSGDKSSNKAMSAAMKYALLEVFCVPTEDDNDTENHSPQPLPQTQPRPAQTPAKATPAPALKPVAKAKDEPKDQNLRARFIAKVISHGITPKQLQEFAVKRSAILPSEIADLDWPFHKMPNNSAEMAELIAAIKAFRDGTDDLPT